MCECRIFTRHFFPFPKFQFGADDSTEGRRPQTPQQKRRVIRFVYFYVNKRNGLVEFWNAARYFGLKIRQQKTKGNSTAQRH